MELELKLATPKDKRHNAWRLRTRVFTPLNFGLLEFTKDRRPVPILYIKSTSTVGS